ncbi:C4-dicarboxylate ABC transporter substrate-binding protein [Motiliproteus coralliicola]|uniref:C4-dicarboxylate ABC transporter substrate-binding protein n=1 Tax=Motiliproteus coralliicola TaxID=2283196 RepID=A0A369WL94_9GAMM|nr:TRAP transporter substrate-binding protein [Motiliproteus coralliicola]RDE22848.1 C4-dicarboxylate ABC transporter substrate-binding protein [Motiliproteus coralliicola]
MKSTKFAKAISLTAGLLLSAGSYAATTWNMAVGDGGGSAQEALGLKFSELLSQKTGGKFDAKLFVNGQLGSEQTTVNEAAMGTLDLSIIASNNLSPFSPSMGILSLPYVFENIGQAQTVVEGPIGEQLVKDAIENANVRVLAWTYSGYRVFTNSKRPVKKLDDLEGLVVRVPKNEIMIDTYKSWGINPTPMAWSETFTALQQKVVDGQDTPYAAIYSMKFGEVQKYLTDIHYLFLLEPLIISESLFQEQKPEVQQALLDAGKEATAYSLDWLQGKEAMIKKELIEQYDMQIDALEDEAEWAKRAQQAVWPKFYDQIGGKEKVNELLRALGRDEV